MVLERPVLKELKLLEYKHLRIKRNLKKDQLSLLCDLSTDPEIIIKPADKGGGIVILDRKD